MSVLVMLALTIAAWLLTTGLVSLPIGFIHFFQHIPNWLVLGMGAIVFLSFLDE